MQLLGAREYHGYYLIGRENPPDTGSSAAAGPFYKKGFPRQKKLS